MNKPMIEIKDLRKTYRVGEVEVHALRGVDLNVAPGEFLAIVGHSGSGKSTLFNILGGLTPATAGTARIGDLNIMGLSDLELTKMRRGTVGFVFQKYNLLPTLSARDNIALAGALSGVNHIEEPWFQDILESLGLRARLHHKPRAMSGGEQQRVAIARALVNKPKVLLADEPTGNLDTENSNAVLDILRRLNKQFQQTILMITHNPEAADFADRKVRMRDGRVAESV
jgi:putative ABC transport system ATP-binding protein